MNSLELISIKIYRREKIKEFYNFEYGCNKVCIHCCVLIIALLIKSA